MYDDRDSKSAALERYQQALIDADIEGLAADPEAEALVAAWRAEGLDAETRIARLKALYRERQALAAQ